MFDSIRDTVPATARGRFYALVAPVITLLVAGGVLSDQLAASVTGVVVALITLFFAVVHSTSPWRQALYAVTGAVATLSVALGWGTESLWGAALPVVAILLGVGTAGSSTPTDDSGHYVEPVQDSEFIEHASQ